MQILAIYFLHCKMVPILKYEIFVVPYGQILVLVFTDEVVL